jgi:hypothetical protein
MIYEVKGREVKLWYAGFEKRENGEFCKRRG